MMMKKLLYFVLLGTLLSACSNDFEVAAPWKEVPIAYGLISPKDTAHYIRIEKAFLDPNVSALEIAQIADSLYYNENAISVWLENTGTQARVPLYRVDGNLEGYVRDSGLFADRPNWLYRTSGPFVTAGKTYELVIERNDGKPDITAQTVVPGDFTFISQKPQNIVREVEFSDSTTTTVEWRTDVNGVYFNIDFEIAYREETPDGTVIFRDTLLWHAAKNIEREEVLVGAGGTYRGKTEISGSQFFRFLSENISPAGNNFRYFDRGSIILEGGGREIREYIITASANSGLTGAETFPVYTNLSEGFGIFTGKNEFILTNVRIGEPTIERMKLNPLTQNLKFRF